MPDSECSPSDTSLLDVIASQPPKTMALAVLECVDERYQETSDADEAASLLGVYYEGLRVLLSSSRFAKFDAALAQLLDEKYLDWM